MNLPLFCVAYILLLHRLLFSYRFVLQPSGSVVKSFSTATGSLVSTFRGHTAPISGITPHPTNPYAVVTTSLDGTIRVWDVEDGTCLKSIDCGIPLVRVASARLPVRAIPRIFVVGALEAKYSDTESTGTSETTSQDKDKVFDTSQGIGSGTGVMTPEVEADKDYQFKKALLYPLGEEVACLLPSPSPYSLPHTIDSNGNFRNPPYSRVFELDLASGKILRVLQQRHGFVTGIDVRCLSSTPVTGSSTDDLTVPDLVVAFTLRESLFLYRSSALVGGLSFTEYAHSRLLSTCSIHASEPYIVTGDDTGRLLTWHLADTLGESHNTPVASFVPIYSGSEAPTHLAPTAPSATPVVSTVHWHSHAATASAIVPDGSVLLTGGEESTLVLWQLPPGTAGGGGPRKVGQYMNFVPRLAAPIRCISTYLSSAPGAMAAASASGPTASGFTRETPPLMYAVTLTNNTLVLLSGLTNRALWTHSLPSTRGAPAILQRGTVIRSTRTLGRMRDAASYKALMRKNASQLERALLPPSKLVPLTPLPSLSYGYTRTLRSGLLYDPLTRQIILNGLPGYSALEFWDLHKDVVTDALPIAPSNVVSRTDEEPPEITRVLHAAISPSGKDLVTVDVSPGTSVGTEICSLKFWHRDPSTQQFQMVSRVTDPHKGVVTALAYHPTKDLVLTTSSDRTFKYWKKETHVSAAAAGAQQAVATKIAAAQAQAEAIAQNPTATVEVAEDKSKFGPKKASRRKGKAAEFKQDPKADAQTGAANVAQGTVVVWSCHSVGFYRDHEVHSASFSGDGSIVALTTGSTVSLWCPMRNTLRAILPVLAAASPAGHVGKGSDSVRIAGQAVAETLGRSHLASVAGVATKGIPQVRRVAFLGNSPLLLVVLDTSISVWNCLSLTPVWTLECKAYPDSLSTTAPSSSDASGDYFSLVAESKAQGPLLLVFNSVSHTPVNVLFLPAAVSAAGTPVTPESLPGLPFPTHSSSSPYATLILPSASVEEQKVLVLDSMNQPTVVPLLAQASGASKASTAASANATSASVMAPTAAKEIVTITANVPIVADASDETAFNAEPKTAVSSVVHVAPSSRVSTHTLLASNASAASIAATQANSTSDRNAYDTVRTFETQLNSLSTASVIPSPSFLLEALLPSLLQKTPSLSTQTSTIPAPIVAGNKRNRSLSGSFTHNSALSSMATPPPADDEASETDVENGSGKGSIKDNQVGAAQFDPQHAIDASVSDHSLATWGLIAQSQQKSSTQDAASTASAPHAKQGLNTFSTELAPSLFTLFSNKYTAPSEKSNAKQVEPTRKETKKPQKPGPQSKKPAPGKANASGSPGTPPPNLSAAPVASDAAATPSKRARKVNAHSSPAAVSEKASTPASSKKSGATARKASA